MYAHHITGELGENLAIKYLEKIGYKILERNFECNRGEVDIIALDKDTIVFIEVKTRRNLIYGMPSDSVNNVKQKHIYKTAEYYLCTRNLENSYVRIDVIEIYIRKNAYNINHIIQAI